MSLLISNTIFNHLNSHQYSLYLPITSRNHQNRKRKNNVVAVSNDIVVQSPSHPTNTTITRTTTTQPNQQEEEEKDVLHYIARFKISGLDEE